MARYESFFKKIQQAEDLGPLLATHLRGRLGVHFEGGGEDNPRKIFEDIFLTGIRANYHDRARQLFQQTFGGGGGGGAPVPVFLKESPFLFIPLVTLQEQNFAKDATWKIGLTHGIVKFLRQRIRDFVGVEPPPRSIGAAISITAQPVLFINRIDIQYRDESLTPLIEALTPIDYMHLFRDAKQYALTEMTLPPLVYEYTFQPGEETWMDKNKIKNVQKELATSVGIPDDSIEVIIDTEKAASTSIKRMKVKRVEVIFKDQVASAPLSSMTRQRFEFAFLPFINPLLKQKMTKALEIANKNIASARGHMRSVQDIAAQFEEGGGGGAVSSKKKKKKKKKSGSSSGGAAAAVAADEEEDEEEEAEAIIAAAVAITQQQRQQDDQAIIRRYAPVLQMQQKIFRSRYHDLLANVYKVANTSGIPLDEARRIFILAMNHRIPSGYVKIIPYEQQQRRSLVNFPLMTRWEPPSSVVMENFIIDVKKSISPETLERLVFKQIVPSRPFKYDYLYGS